MDFELYKKIIGDLDRFPQVIKVLRLQLGGEPLLNKRFPDMVRYAKEKQPLTEVDTTTNASLLTPDVSDALIDSGLDKLFISLQGMDAGAYKSISEVDIDFDKVLNNVLYFCRNRHNCKVYIKVPDIGINESEERQFYELFADYADEMFVERIIPTWPDFDISNAKTDDGIGYYGKPIDTKYINVCPLIFYDMVIDFDGSVIPCSVDWAHLTNLGTVQKRSLHEVWNSHELNELRRLHLRGERHLHPLCGKCVTLQYCNVDQIDEYADELLNRFDSLP